MTADARLRARAAKRVESVYILRYRSILTIARRGAYFVNGCCHAIFAKMALSRVGRAV
jgi:hypothetical protein